MHEIKSVVENKTGGAEVRMTDSQSWNSCRKVASDREFTFGSAIKAYKEKSRMHFVRVPYKATSFSQNRLPLWSGCTGQYVCLLY